MENEKNEVTHEEMENFLDELTKEEAGNETAQQAEKVVTPETNDKTSAKNDTAKSAKAAVVNQEAKPEAQERTNSSEANNVSGSEVEIITLVMKQEYDNQETNLRKNHPEISDELMMGLKQLAFSIIAQTGNIKSGNLEELYNKIYPQSVQGNLRKMHDFEQRKREKQQTIAETTKANAEGAKTLEDILSKFPTN